MAPLPPCHPQSHCWTYVAEQHLAYNYYPVFLDVFDIQPTMSSTPSEICDYCSALTRSLDGRVVLKSTGSYKRLPRNKLDKSENSECSCCAMLWAAEPRGTLVLLVKAFCTDRGPFKRVGTPRLLLLPDILVGFSQATGHDHLVTCHPLQLTNLWNVVFIYSYFTAPCLLNQQSRSPQ